MEDKDDSTALFNEKSLEENNNLRNYFNNLWKEKKFFDLTLKTEDGKIFQVHKIILCSYSEFFHEQLIELPLDEIELDENVDSESLALILEYIYNGYIDKDKIDLRQAIKLYKAAAFLRMPLLESSIENYLMTTMTSESCLKLWRWRVDELSENIREAVIRFIQTQCSEFLDFNYLELNAKEIKHILCFECLQSSQEEILSNILKWLKVDYENRQQHMKDIIELIDINAISSEFINKNIINDELLYGNKFILQYFAKEQNLRLKKLEVRYFQKDEENTTPWLIDEFSVNKINMGEKQIVKFFDWHKRRENGFSVTKFKENDFFFTGPLKSCEYFSNNESYPIASMLVAREYHSSINFKNKIYCCGGFDSNMDEDLSSTEIFDLKHMEWLRASSMNSDRSDFSLIEYDNSLYAIGGSDSKSSEIYDYRVDKWFGVTNNDFVFKEFTRAIVYKNKIFVTNISHEKKVFEMTIKNKNLEIIKIYMITEMKSDYWCTFGLFADANNLYLLNNDGENFLNCYKLNENTEDFELFAEQLTWRDPNCKSNLDMFHVISN